MVEEESIYIHLLSVLHSWVKLEVGAVRLNTFFQQFSCQPIGVVVNDILVRLLAIEQDDYLLNATLSTGTGDGTVVVADPLETDAGKAALDCRGSLYLSFGNYKEGFTINNISVELRRVAYGTGILYPAVFKGFVVRVALPGCPGRARLITNEVADFLVHPERNDKPSRLDTLRGFQLSFYFVAKTGANKSFSVMVLDKRRDCSVRGGEAAHLLRVDAAGKHHLPMRAGEITDRGEGSPDLAGAPGSKGFYLFDDLPVLRRAPMFKWVSHHQGELPPGATMPRALLSIHLVGDYMIAVLTIPPAKVRVDIELPLPITRASWEGTVVSVNRPGFLSLTKEPVVVLDISRHSAYLPDNRLSM